MTVPLLLFDIDGTLLRTEGGTLRAMARAAQAVFKPDFSFDGIDTFGQLDSLILDRALLQNGMSPNEQRVAAFKERYFVEIAKDAPTFRLLPGVVALVEHLRSAGRYTLGLVTGNFQESAEIKLQGVGLAPRHFPIGAFGGEDSTRAGLVRLAMQRAELHTERSLAAEQVLVIGDTPRDIACAQANNAKCLAVATGGFDADSLRDAGADAVVHDFARTEQIVATIDQLVG